MPDISASNIPLMNEIVSAALAAGCLKDEEFRANLEAGKLAAIIGQESADLLDNNNIAVRMVQNTADTVNIVLPCYEALDEAWMEMTDEQLEKIAGGVVFEIVTVCTLIGVGVSLTIGAITAGKIVITATATMTAIGAGVLIGVGTALGGAAAVGLYVGVGLHLANQNQDVAVGHAS